MTEVHYKPVRHSHKEFLAKAATRKGFVEAYDALACKIPHRVSFDERVAELALEALLRDNTIILCY